MEATGILLVVSFVMYLIVKNHKKQVFLSVFMYFKRENRLYNAFFRTIPNQSSYNRYWGCTIFYD